MAGSDKKKKSAPADGKSSGTKKSSGKTGGSKVEKNGKSSAAARKTSQGASSKSAQRQAAGKTASGTGAGGFRLKEEVMSVILIAAGVFLAVSVMTSATGQFGAVLSYVLKGLFGIGAYILPFYIILYALLVLMKKMARINGRSIFFLILMYIDMVTVNSVRFSELTEQSFSLEFIKQMYRTGVELKSAGAVGMTVDWAAERAIGSVGLLIVCAAVFIVSLMLLINTPISSFFDARREKKYQNALAREAQREEDQARESERRQMQEVIRQEKAENGREMERKRSERAGLEDSFGDAEDEFGRLRIRNTEFFRSEAEANGGQQSKNQEHILEYMNTDDLFDTYTVIENDEEKPQAFSSYKEIAAGEEKETVSGRDSRERRGESGAEAASGSAGSTDAESTKKESAFSILRRKAAAGFAARSGSQATQATDNQAASDAGLETEQDAGKNGGEDGGSGAADASSAAPQVSPMMKTQAQAVIAAGAAEVASQADQTPDKKQYRLPPLSLLNEPKKQANRNLEFELAMKAQKLENVLHDFGVSARVIDVKKGPSVTRYEIQPDTGVKVSSIVRLTDDIALNLEAKSLRIEAPIPGKAAIGIEIENENTSLVTLREMIESDNFQKAESKISFVVGMDIAGNCVVGDLKTMPHLLIAGSTGSGKSVCINSIIMSILYKSTPDEVRLILIDPKVVELGNYNGIPHMLIPVITDPSKAAAALAWAVQEMNDRYKKFAETGVRDLQSYNTKREREGQPESVLPQIVIIIDELADLMMAAPSQVEEAICRLAQLARAAGMHLIVATQRPSVDIVTGLIKANIPSRIAFAVSSQFDSRTILDRSGAEKLVGRGDMLFSPIGKPQPERLQGPFVTDDEVAAVIDFWKAQAEKNEGEKAKKIMESIDTVKIETSNDEGEDELLDDAIELVVNAEQASASMLQRRFRIGYNRAGRLIDIMESRGIIGPSEGSKPRRVLISKDEYYGSEAENSESRSENGTLSAEKNGTASGSERDKTLQADLTADMDRPDQPLFTEIIGENS